MCRLQNHRHKYIVCGCKQAGKGTVPWNGRIVHPKSGRMKSSLLITHENCEGSISLTRRTRNSRETIKNARKKLETPVALVVPCEIMKSNKNGGSGCIQ